MDYFFKFILILFINFLNIAPFVSRAFVVLVRLLFSSCMSPSSIARKIYFRKNTF